MSRSDRRVVITGMGLVSPLGSSPSALWQSLSSGTSGVDFLKRVPTEPLPSKIGGEASDFTGSIDNFGDLEKKLKRSIKKALKLMCREIEMGVATAQFALAQSQLSPEVYDPQRIGTMFGSDYIITEPHEFTSGIQKCLDGKQEFDFKDWAENGIPNVEPLWLLKYLPNMPASHVAIFNDLRGPSNSLTVREASSNLAIAEATAIIKRGTADQMVTGSTGSRIHMLRTIHCTLQEQLAKCEDHENDPTKASRPFESKRSGMVMGEGAGCLILEEMESAKSRGVQIFGEVIGYSSSTVADQKGVADYKTAFGNVIHMALEVAGIKASDIGHVNAHGLSGIRCDKEEAQAINESCGDKVPVVAMKSSMGNLGAGSGIVEIIGSLMSLQNDDLFETLNFAEADKDCPINVVTASGVSPGDCFINLNITPQGQASAVIIRRV